MTTTRSVPCGACTLCCRGGEVIVLHPECGDRIEDYETREIWSPLEGNGPVRILEQQPNGDCIYVGPFGCTIWDRRPTICREFDCRDFVRRFDHGKAKHQKFIRKGYTNSAVFQRGRELIAQEKAGA